MFDVESAVLIHVGHLSPDPGWSMPVHAHPGWEFIYFLSGSGRVDVPNASYRAQRYSLLVYPPGLPHAEVSNPTDPEETIVLCFDTGGEAPPGAHLLLADLNGDIGWLCRHIMSECFAGGGVTPLTASYARSFLHLVAQLWDQGVAVKHNAVDMAAQFMHDNYAQPITLDQLANLACMSRTYFAHCFTVQNGISPMRYLRQLRLEAAKRLLVTSDAPIGEIAPLVGFREVFHFSKAFKSSVGCSPNTFRKSSKQETAYKSDETTSIPPTPNLTYNPSGCVDKGDR